MYGYDHGMSGWSWFFAGSMMIVFLAFVIGLAVYIAIRLGQRPPPHS